MKTIVLIYKEIRHMWKNQKNIFIAIILMFFASTYGTLFLYNGYLRFEEIEKKGIDLDGYSYEYVLKVKDVEDFKRTIFEINDKFNLKSISVMENRIIDYPEYTYWLCNEDIYRDADSENDLVKGRYPSGKDKANQIVLGPKYLGKYDVGDKFKVRGKEYTVCGFDWWGGNTLYLSEMYFNKGDEILVFVNFSSGKENIKNEEVGEILKNDPNTYEFKVDGSDYDSFVEESELYIAEERQTMHDFMSVLLGIVLVNMICALIVLLYTNKKRYDLLWMLGLKKRTLMELNILPVFIYSVIGYLLGVIAFCASKPIFSLFFVKHYIDFQSITTGRVMKLIFGNFVWYETAIIIVEIILMLVILRRKRGGTK